MKRIAIAVLTLSFAFGGIFSVKIAMADTTNKQENTDINYDSPLMTDDDSDSLAKMNLENYDVMVTTFMSPSVERRIPTRRCIGTRLTMEQNQLRMEQRIQALVQTQRTVENSRILDG